MERENSLSASLGVSQLECVKDSNPGLSRPNGTMLSPWTTRNSEPFLPLWLILLCGILGASQPLCAIPWETSWKLVEQVPLQAWFVELLLWMNNAEYSLLRPVDSRVPALGGAGRWGWGTLLRHTLLTARKGCGVPGRGSAALSSGLIFCSNWCPYQKSRLVTFIATCQTEKFLVHSQQPCPQGAPDCQNIKIM